MASGNFSPPLSMRTAAAVEQKEKATQVIKQTPTKEILKLSKDEIPLLQSLQKRQADLIKREQKVSKQEEELEQLKKHLEEKLANLEMLRNEIGELIKEREAFEERRFEHLVKVYEGMKPAEAGPLVERLNEETAVKLFYRMKEQKVSRIFGFIKPEIAAQLSERLASYQSTTDQASR
jgi:flagellar motility protein MotE (MotC chaperone)